MILSCRAVLDSIDADIHRLDCPTPVDLRSKLAPRRKDADPRVIVGWESWGAISTNNAIEAMNMSTSRADPKLNILVRGRDCTRPLHLAGDRKNMPQNL